LLLVFAALVYLPLCGPLATAQTPESASAAPEESDPLPLRRLLVPTEQLARELEHVRSGALVEMPRADFEAQVRRAARAAAILKRAPRLLEATYTARLDESALVGTANWMLVNPAPAGGILSLQPFNLALRQTQLDGAPALLGDVDGTNLGLFVDQPGRHRATLQWSARGEPGPGGQRFKLEVPPCALTSFLLDLPADRRILLPPGDSCLLSGPFPALRPAYLAAVSVAPGAIFPGVIPWVGLSLINPAPPPARLVWRIDCVGTSTVDLVVRQAGRAGQAPPLVLTRLQSSQTLTPGWVEADYDFSLEVLHDAIGEIVCRCDPSLRPISVGVRNGELETWEFTPGLTPGAPATLRIRLPEPYQGSALPVHLHCLAPLRRGQPWTSPSVEVVGAVPRGETLQLQVAPELRLDDWQAGDYDLVKSAATPGGQVLTLQMGLGQPAAPDTSRRRPRAWIQMQEPEFRVRQINWWRIRPENSALTVQLSYEVLRGRLFRLPIALPPDWTVDQIDGGTPGLLRNWTLMPVDQGRTVVIIDLRHPLQAAAVARLTLGLHPVKPLRIPFLGTNAASAETGLTFPVAEPLGARLREGALAISIDPALHAAAHASVPATAPPRHTNEGPGRNLSGYPFPFAFAAASPLWGAQTPDYYYAYQGEPVSGTLRLRPRRPRVRVGCTSDVVVASGRAALQVRLRLEPDVGNPDVLDLYVSAPIVSDWHWQSEGHGNAVRDLRRRAELEAVPWLLALGAATPGDAAALVHAASLRGTHWRLMLERPLREPLMLETAVDLVSQETAADAATRLIPPAGSVLDTLGWAVGMRGVGDRMPRERRWEVPLLVAGSPGDMQGVVRLHLAGTDLVQVEADGLRETAAVGSGPAAWRSFQYETAPVALRLRGQAGGTDRMPIPRATRVQLTTYVDPPTCLREHFCFHIDNWKQQTLPVRLPAGADLLAVRVDGRWIPPPRTGLLSDGTREVDLPIPAGRAAHVVELAYNREAPAWTLWGRLHFPAPALPVATASLRRTWCLAPGLVPLQESAVQRLPGPGDRSAWDPIEAVLALDRILPSFAAGDSLRNPAEEIGTDRGSRRPGARAKTLRGTVALLTFEALKGRDPLVIDAVALCEAGLEPDTPTREATPALASAKPTREEAQSRAVLERLGLSWVPGPEAILLTTTRQRQGWAASDNRDPQIPQAVREAVAAAALHGHDSSGRYRSALDWLGEQGWGNSEERLVETLPLLAPPEGWTAWEPVAGMTAETGLTVVRVDTLAGAAWGLALLLPVGLWRARQRGLRGRYAVLLLWLAISTAGFLWLPTALRALAWPPLLFGFVTAGLWYLAFLLRSTAARTVSAAAIVGSLVVAQLMGLPGQAAPLEPATVWLLPGPAGAPQKQTALVPQEVLDHLQGLIRRAAPPTQGALLLGADYEGSAASGSADLKAVFQAYCFGDEPVPLVLPLWGVELRAALLDGAAAYPVTLPAPQSGYTLRLKGPGVHKIELQFTVRLAAGREGQELRCTVPELTQSRLRLTVPAGARYLQAVFGRGAQRVTNDAAGVHLEADLGRVNTLQVRWREEGPPATPAAAQVKELYLWNLRGSTGQLLGVLQYTVSRGALTRLLVALPEHLEVRRVETTALPGSGAAARLSEWLLTGPTGERQLELRFAAPVTSGVQVFLDLVLRSPLGPSVVLALPTPQDVAYGAGLLAYRVEGRPAEVADDYRRVTGLKPREFSHEWQEATTEEARLPDGAYRFRRASGAPYLRLNLRGPVRRVRCTQAITWQLGSRKAEVHASAHLTALAGSLEMVEWDLAATDFRSEWLTGFAYAPLAAFPANLPWTVLHPASTTKGLPPKSVLITSVAGPEVRSWSQTGSRLQIWLRRSLREVTVELTGWQQPSAGESAGFRLPCFQMINAMPPRTSIRVMAERGTALVPSGLYALWPLPEPRPSDNDLRYVATQAGYGGTFRGRPAAEDARVRVFTLAEARERELTFRTIFDCRLGPGGPRRLTIGLHSGQGPNVHLEVPQRSGIRVNRQDPAAGIWTLELPPGEGGHFQVALRGSQPLNLSGEMRMPQVTVEGTALTEYWLSVAGHELQAAEVHGLTRAANAVAALQDWPEARDRLRQAGGSVWQAAPDWSLRLRVRSRLAEARPVEVLLNEQAAAVLDGQRWTHQATYRLYHEAGADLRLRLPQGAQLQKVLLDGSELMPLATRPAEVWLPLLGGGGAHRICLCWVFDAGSEPLVQPNLEQPQLLGVSNAEPVWTVHVPPGYRLGPASRAVAESAAAQDLDQAAAYLKLSRLLAEGSPNRIGDSQSEQLQSAQEAFTRSCRAAEYRLAMPTALQEPGLDRSGLLTRLRDLREANRQLARAHHYEPVRLRAEDSSAAESRPPLKGPVDFLAEQGTPTRWRATSADGPPELRLVAVEIEQAEHALGFTGLLLVLVLLAWIVSYFPRVVDWVRALWPEQLALLGLLGSYAFGLHVLVIVPVLLGVGARLILLLRWGLARWSRPASVGAAASNSAAAS
jgi:hypothetical protein